MISKEEEIIQLKQRIYDLEEKLKKYTNGNNHKTYYEKNKECNNVQTINEETIKKTTEINRNNKNTSSRISQEMILDIIKSNELYRKIIFELLKTIGETSKTYTNSLGGFGEEQQNKLDEKIITNIAKKVLVDKTS